MEYSALAEAYARAEVTSKRLELAEIVAGLLEDTPLALVRPVVHLTQGRLAAEFEGLELGLSEKLAIEAVARVAGVSEKEVVDARNREGDIGSAAETLLGRKSQALLFGTALTVQGVYKDLLDIASETGAGSQDRKLKTLQRLLSNADPREARYLVRTVTGKLRLGVQDATVLDALAALITDGVIRSVQEMEGDERARREAAKAALEHANDVTSDLGTVAEVALRPWKEADQRLGQGDRTALSAASLAAVGALRMRVGTPLRAMLAERLSSAAEIIEKLGGTAALEYKYDGLRVQAHIGSDGHVKLFSRRLEDLTPQFPDVAESLRATFSGHEAIVEGEAVAIEPDSGRMLPFQVVSHRRGRKYGVAERAEASQTDIFGVTGAAERGATALSQYPIATYLFDLLYLDGAEWLDRPYHARRAQLEAVFPPGPRVAPSTMEQVTTPEAIDAFMQRALAEGAEGIMAKNPESRYKAGSREWSWIKYKADYVEGLADTLDLAVVGAYYGQGRRAGWYGAFLLAAWDPDKNRFETVCRVATGFDDSTLEKLRDELEPDARSTPPAHLVERLADKPDVWLEPRMVMEVSGAEFTLSPMHTCAWGEVKADAGLAVRFPRFTGRTRDDKSPTGTTTPQEIVGMYRRQVKVAGAG